MLHVRIKSFLNYCVVMLNIAYKMFVVVASSHINPYYDKVNPCRIVSVINVANLEIFSSIFHELVIYSLCAIFLQFSLKSKCIEWNHIIGSNDTPLK